MGRSFHVGTVAGVGPANRSMRRAGVVAPIARIMALLVAVAMFVFSCWMFARTGDWVAAVFALGSVAYGFYFFNSGGDGRA